MEQFSNPNQRKNILKLDINFDEIEVMSPAGNWECLMTAINSGADAVYFGIEGLNMRAKSSNNFTIDDLSKIVSLCEAKSVKTYLTVNTVIYDRDIELMKEIVDSAKKHSITAIIAADQAVLAYANSIKMPVHISTQANISNIESVKFYSMFSDVLVLARELSLDNIYDISKQIKEQNITGPSGKLVQIEAFVHGALCMAVSSKCYLSLHHYDKSANRGECRQQCRKEYIVKEKGSDTELEIDNGYIMSPKDLCTIEFLDQVIGAGIKVLKIEGRGRAPEYVKRVTETYKKAVQYIRNGEYNDTRKKELKSNLEEVFNRGFTDYYYFGRKTEEWTEKPGSKATMKKVYIGKVSNYFSNIGVSEFVVEAQGLKVSDRILIIGETTGTVESEVIEIRNEVMDVVNSVGKGEKFTIAIKEKVRRNDQLYKLVDSNSIKEKRYMKII